MTQTIQFIFEITDADHEVSDFSFGHLTLIMGEETISSNSAWENDMMVFVSLPLLIDSVASLTTGTHRAREFDAISSRFGFEIHKSSAGRIRVLYRERWIGEADLTDFMQALFQAASLFAAEYWDRLPTVRQDLADSLQGLEEAIRTYQPPVKKTDKKHTPRKLR
jgi:hypothetical protein